MSEVYVNRAALFEDDSDFHSYRMRMPSRLAAEQYVHKWKEDDKTIELGVHVVNAQEKTSTYHERMSGSWESFTVHLKPGDRDFGALSTIVPEPKGAEPICTKPKQLGKRKIRIRLTV